MKTEYPSPTTAPGLRALWKEAFGDSDAFLDLFFGTAYDPDRCRCILQQGRITAALYWMDLDLEDQKFAYIYAVATARESRGQGLCKLLMADTAQILRQNGYHGALLVPQDEGLRTMYSRMGYRDSTPIGQFFCAGADTTIPVKEITAENYVSLRPGFLPEGSLQPGNKAMAFLSALARFYAGNGLLATVSREPEHLRILEYLGDARELPGLIAALGATEATVRAPGTDKPFAMYLPLTGDCRKPEYYPFAFD